MTQTPASNARYEVKQYLLHLKESDRTAIMACANRLFTELHPHIRSAVLFGSKARSDDTVDSDIDILIIVDTDDRGLARKIRRTAARVSLEYDVLFNTHIISQEQWSEMERHQTTYWRNVQREGIELRPESVRG